MTTTIYMDYPVSANRYWRTCRGRTYRSAEADQYKAAAKLAAARAGVVALDGPVAVTDASLDGFAFTTRRGCLVDAARAGRVLAALTGQ